MADIFSVVMEGDRALVARFKLMPERLRNALLQKVYALSFKLRDKVQKEHLSGPTGPHTLSVGQSSSTHTAGQLRASVHASVDDKPTSITGKVAFGSDVVYAAIHEFGGTVQIPELVPVKAKALRFMVGGKEVFARRVKAHAVTIPERAPLRTSLYEMKDEIVKGLEEAVNKALNL
jgi:phage gpG-like protein